MDRDTRDWILKKVHIMYLHSLSQLRFDAAATPWESRAKQVGSK